MAMYERVHVHAGAGAVAGAEAFPAAFPAALPAAAPAASHAAFFEALSLTADVKISETIIYVKLCTLLHLANFSFYFKKYYY